MTKAKSDSAAMAWCINHTATIDFPIYGPDDRRIRVRVSDGRVGEGLTLSDAVCMIESGSKTKSEA